MPFDKVLYEDYCDTWKFLLRVVFVLCMGALLIRMPTVQADERWVYPARENGLWGYINQTGEFVIEPQWDAVGDMRGNGYAWVCSVPVEEEVFSDEEGWHWEEVYQHGIVNLSGDYVAELAECYADEGYGGEYYGGKDTGVIMLGSLAFDVVDGTMLPKQWTYWPWGLSHDAAMLPVYDDASEGIGFADRKTGELVIDCAYGESVFEEGFALVWSIETDEYVLIDESGRQLILPEGYVADWDSAFSEGLKAVLHTESGLYGFCDRGGVLQIEAAYEDVGSFSEGYAAVCRDGLWGHIDHDGHMICEPRFACNGYSFRNGLAVVEREEGDCVIRPDGTVVFEYAKGRIWDFDEYGTAIFEADGNMGIVNSDGKILLDPSEGYSLVYDYGFGFAHPFPEGLMRVSKEEKLGFVDRMGRESVKCEWDEAEQFNHGLARVSKDGRLAYVDLTGNVVWKEQD